MQLGIWILVSTLWMGTALAQTPAEATAEQIEAEQKEADAATPPEPAIEPESNVDAEVAQPEIVEEPAPEAEPEPLPQVQSTRSTEPTALSQIEDVPMADTSEVEVEAMKAQSVTKDCHCEYHVGTPYKERRKTFGAYFGAQLSNYAPTKYVPDFVNGMEYGDYFEAGSFKLVEGVMGLKWNMFLGSLGVTATGGFFRVASKDGQGVLSANPLTGGITLALDTIFSEPYVVPYGTAGMYTVMYKETRAGLGVEGRTPFRPFFAAGLMFQLDWMDKSAHNFGYKDYGLENTFLYGEVRSFMGSTSDDPDFSTGLQASAGLKVEF